MSDPLVVIRLAGNPVGKGRPRFARGTGHSYTPEKTRNYETCLRLAAQDVMGGRPPFDGPLDVRLVAYMPIPASRPKKWQAAARAGAVRPETTPDADNLLKCCDAMNQIVFVDDKQAVDATVRKYYSDTPGIVIEIRTAAMGLPS